jgi:chromosomal replication initiation ATPase DnaA
MGSFQDPAIFLGLQRASLAQAIVAQVYSLPAAELRGKTRGRPIAARARQVVLYLAHTVFAMSPGQLAAEFGRDRSTVRHACDVVAQRRQSDDEFDSTLRWLEAHLRGVSGMVR